MKKITIVKILLGIFAMSGVLTSCDDEDYATADEPFFLIESDSMIYVKFMSPNDTGFRSSDDHLIENYYLYYWTNGLCPMDMNANEMRYKLYLESNDSLLGELYVEYELDTKEKYNSTHATDLVLEKFLVDTVNSTLKEIYGGRERIFSIEDSTYILTFTDNVYNNPEREVAVQRQKFYLKF